jgi:hypothetical protein
MGDTGRYAGEAAWATYRVAAWETQDGMQEQKEQQGRHRTPMQEQKEQHGRPMGGSRERQDAMQEQEQQHGRPIGGSR